MAKEYKIKILKNGEKRYIFDVNIGYRADGSRMRTTITAKTVKEGRRKVAELTLNKSNKLITDKNALFHDVYDRYILDCEKRGLSPITLNNKKFILRSKYTRFENTKISKIKDVDLIEWIEWLKKDLKNSTVKNHEADLIAFFNWCVKKKILDTNPFTYIDRTKSDKTELNFWTEKQFNEFLKIVDNDTHKLIFTTLFYTGLRKSEFCGLSENDVNLNKNELHLSHTVKCIKDGLILTSKFKNENSKRIVPMPKWLTPQLYKFLKNKSYPFKNYYNYLNKILSNYLKQTDLPYIRVHDLRHSYVSMLINKGVDIYTVSQMVGHADIKTTINIYGDLYPDKREYITSLFD